MSFIKSLLIAVLATVLITYFLGTTLLELLGIQLEQFETWRVSMEAINMSALGGIAIALVIALVLFTVFGVFILVFTLILSCIAFAIVGAFWPMIIVAMLIYFICRNKTPRVQPCY